MVLPHSSTMIGAEYNMELGVLSNEVSQGKFLYESNKSLQLEEDNELVPQAFVLLPKGLFNHTQKWVPVALHPASWLVTVPNHIVIWNGPWVWKSNLRVSWTSGSSPWKTFSLVLPLFCSDMWFLLRWIWVVPLQFLCSCLLKELTLAINSCLTIPEGVKCISELLKSLLALPYNLSIGTLSRKMLCAEVACPFEYTYIYESTACNSIQC